MSATDERTQDPALSHPSENQGHEMSDFSWTTVLWLLPISVVILLVFTLISLYWFRGAKDHQIARKQQVTGGLTQLQSLRAKEDEALHQYKWLDKDKGRVQIPIDRAMALVVEEDKNSGTLDYRPITDIYLEANPAGRLASRVPEPVTPPGAETAPPVKAPAPAPAKHEAAAGKKPAAAAEKKPEAAAEKKPEAATEKPKAKEKAPSAPASEGQKHK